MKIFNFKFDIRFRPLVSLKYSIYHEDIRNLDTKILIINYLINPPFYRNRGPIQLYQISSLRSKS